MREVWLRGPESVDELAGAVAAALDGGDAVLPLDGGDPKASALLAGMRPDQPVEPGTAVIIATSGSTGEPKGVLLSAEALRASATATHARLGGPGRWLLATPANYIGGLQVLVRSMVAGQPFAVLPPGPFRAERFAEAARPVLAGDGPRYTAMVPTQLTRLLDAGGAGLDAARAFDAIIIGAAATTPALGARAGEAGVRIVPAYGMSETASGCVYDGVPLDGVDVRIADDGRVLLTGPVLTHGYRLRPDLTADAFDGKWFRTGDRGRFGGGRLEVLGRMDDVINTGGVKVSAAAVERLITALPGVRESCVVGLPDPEWGQIVAAAVIPEGDGPSVDDLRTAVRSEAGAAAVPKRVEFVTTLPLRGPGKIDRTAVAEQIFPPVG
ncbi:o-succinylbenzoate--CoA ligase [Amycolatopsis endophytica]|uniref:O-succinylbenzoic acid--CoA ligase n=1 Tax=Amycolatopsis endophytica TaxID=860233 RepID=A0A853AYW9_9PSEU|nr:o-succinylbenzoate--CoA ligase [Amycolatopsis endophytica]NYI87983.1 O-succinylbenzoic acid--CoA ligase [Amycolatopsis endophytica]